MNILRYAIVGTGMMGQEHLRNLALINQTQEWSTDVVALIDPDKYMREEAAALAVSLGYANAKAYTELASVDSSDIDVFVIVTPNFTHYRILSELIKTGKAILAEKPVCTTLPQCADLKNQLVNYPSAFWVAMEYRYMPPTARFIQRLASGEIGPLTLLTIKEHRYPFLEKVGDWNRFNDNTGGTLVEKCCHHFDLMRLLTGSEPLRIYASGGMDVNHLDEQYEGRIPDILDNALVIVDFENGVRASLELCMFADSAEPQEQLTAIGKNGKLDAYIPGPDRFWPDAGERHARVVFSPRDQSSPVIDVIEVDAELAAAGDHHGSTFYQHLQFGQAVMNGTAVEVSAEDGVKAVRMGAAAQESIRTGQAIDMKTFTLDAS